MIMRILWSWWKDRDLKKDDGNDGADDDKKDKDLQDGAAQMVADDNDRHNDDHLDDFEDDGYNDDNEDDDHDDKICRMGQQRWFWLISW